MSKDHECKCCRGEQHPAIIASLPFPKEADVRRHPNYDDIVILKIGRDDYYFSDLNATRLRDKLSAALRGIEE